MTVARNIPNLEIVNGLDVGGLESLINRAKADPTAAITKWQVTSSWEGQAHIHAKVDSFSMGGKSSKRGFSIDIDEPPELLGADDHANPQDHLLAALNACMMIDYVAQCSIRRIKLESLEIETRGEIDLRGFLGVDPAVRAGYENIDYIVRVKGDGTPEQFAEVHEAVMATSPNFYNLTKPVTLRPKLIVE
ncbi:osmotically inducible protein C [Bradyrhizobium sp. CCBAU 25338]|nr:osmotically inducible protein C [Bradyrhizobium sp. CCBAU 25338]